MSYLSISFYLLFFLIRADHAPSLSQPKLGRPNQPNNASQMARAVLRASSAGAPRATPAQPYHHKSLTDLYQRAAHYSVYVINIYNQPDMVLFYIYVLNLFFFKISFKLARMGSKPV